MADTSKVGLLLGGGIRHITATQAQVKEVPACVRKYCFNALIFRQYFVCLRERIFNCCKVLMLSWSWSSRSNSGGYLRDYSPQWTPFFSPFRVVTQSTSSTGAVGRPIRCNVSVLPRDGRRNCMFSEACRVLFVCFRLNDITGKRPKDPEVRVMKPRPRPKFWPQFGLEVLSSLLFWWILWQVELNLTLRVLPVNNCVIARWAV